MQSRYLENRTIYSVLHINEIGEREPVETAQRNFFSFADFCLASRQNCLWVFGITVWHVIFVGNGLALPYCIGTVVGRVFGHLSIRARIAHERGHIEPCPLVYKFVYLLSLRIRKEKIEGCSVADVREYVP